MQALVSFSHSEEKKNLIKIIFNDTKLLNLMIKNLDVNIKFCIYNVLEKYMYSLSSLVYEKVGIEHDS